MTLQEQFLRNHGGPIYLDGIEVFRMDTVIALREVITARFIKASGGHGIALKAPKGRILLSDGTKIKFLHVWFSRTLPNVVRHVFYTSNGALKIWNIYRIFHFSGLITTEERTGNAGMIIEKKHPQSRSYRRSRGHGENRSSRNSNARLSGNPFDQ